MIPHLWYTYGQEIEKCFILDAVDRMHQANYNAKLGEISSLMDAHISRVYKGNKELYFEMEEDKKEAAQRKE